jgi:peptidoglycan/LPS O-acetylase OafA/YrhL
MPQDSSNLAETIATAPAGRPIKNYIPTLDGWRAVAIVIVLLCHGSDSMQRALGHWSAPVADFLKLRGLAGVRIFFGISGFLITSRLLDEMKQSSPGILRRFYIRRAFRILPPAVGFLLILGGLSVAGVVDVSARSWLASMFFLNNYFGANGWYTGHFWSLAVEEHFYMLWPSLLLLLGMVGGAWLATGLSIAVVMWRAVCYHFQWGMGEHFYGRTDIQLDGLLWGAVMARYYAEPKVREALRALLGWPVGPLLVVGVMVSFAFQPHHGWKVFHALYAAQAIAIPFMLLSTVLHPKGMISRVLESAALGWLGRMSYSVYLWQQLFCVWDSARDGRLYWVQVWPINFAAPVVCAMLSYHFLEQPFIRMGSRLAKGRAAGRVEAVLV